MSYTIGNPADRASAVGILVGTYEEVNPILLDMQVPEIMFPAYAPEGVPILTAEEGANVYTKVWKNTSGVGDYRAVGSNSVPSVGVSTEKTSVRLLNAGVSTSLDTQDIARATMARSRNIAIDAMVDIATASRMAALRHQERVFFFGAASFGFEGLINASDVAAGTAPQIWNLDTADEILFDIQSLLSLVNESTRGIITPSSLYLPIQQYNLISQLRIPLGVLPVLDYIQTTGFVPSARGDLEVKALRYLKGAGAGGTDRMMVATKEPRYYLAAEAIPFRMREPVQSLYTMELPAEYKFSELKLVTPDAFAYLDGI